MSQTLGLVLLARLLPPSAFGTMSLAATAVWFAALFRDLGLSTSVVQRKQLSQRLLSAIHWSNVVLGLVICAVLIMLALLIGPKLGDRELGGLVAVLALSFPITSLSLVHQALLERGAHFDVLARIETISAISALLVAIVAAFVGIGTLCFAMQSLTAASLTAVQLRLAADWHPDTTLDLSALRDVGRFGGALTGFNILNYWARNADNLLIGTFVGISQLGYYALAYQIVISPIQSVSGVLNRALLTTFSSIQNDNARFRNAYSRLLTVVVFGTAPLISYCFVMRELLVFAMLGREWQPMVPILTWLLPVALMQSVGATIGLVYIAKGRTDLQLRWGIIAIPVLVASFAVGLPWGVVGVAASYCCAYSLVFPLSLIMPLSLIDMRPSELLSATVWPLLCAIAMGVTVVIGDSVCGTLGLGILTRLLCTFVVGAAVYSLLTMVFMRDVVFHTLDYMKAIRKQAK